VQIRSWVLTSGQRWDVIWPWNHLRREKYVGHGFALAISTALHRLALHLASPDGDAECQASDDVERFSEGMAWFCQTVNWAI
jgi:hypothetical protein